MKVKSVGTMQDELSFIEDDKDRTTKIGFSASKVKVVIEAVRKCNTVFNHKTPAVIFLEHLEEPSLLISILFCKCYIDDEFIIGTVKKISRKQVS
ncbi:unnamed protein product [Haemonchus placei]|uniref:THUMP domain-containing protein n=1 Tax=Haemonchus placei TaxID=6290 RepID=A0A0N4WWC9_HAEPC|nr:unnamed protein product [Haemonchus placei]